MLPIAITSLALARARSMEEIIPQKWKERWDDYLELRILVSLSLTFQLILIALGGRRKKIRHYWIRIVVWFAYLSADAVAMYALGVIRIEPPPKCCDGSGSNSTTDSTTDLRALWAPFLLMHLGGPDTITAYALEDNELWLRHCLALVSQTVLTLYVLFLSWNGTYISWLFVVILICGLIKYGERVWVLWAASSERFRDSTPQGQHQIPRMLEKKLLKQAEGHLVVAHQVIELHEVLDHGVGVDWQSEETTLSYVELYKRRQGEILIARGLLDIFRPAFTDQLLSLDDRDTGRSTLQDKYYLSVFNIIAIELGFIYDLLFTKAMICRTPWGIASRVVTLSLTTITLCVFTPLYKKEASQYDKTDLVMTFVLMTVAITLELYALLFHHLFTDKVMCWLIRKKHWRILSFINCFRPLRVRRRWSGKIGQFSLLSYSLKEKHYFFGRNILEIQKYFYHSDIIVSDDLKKRLYEHIKVTMPDTMYKDLQSLWALKWKDPIRNEELESLKWSIELEFDMSILVWHIATDICYQDFLKKRQENIEGQFRGAEHARAPRFFYSDSASQDDDALEDAPATYYFNSDSTRQDNEANENATATRYLNSDSMIQEDDALEDAPATTHYLHSDSTSQDSDAMEDAHPTQHLNSDSMSQGNDSREYNQPTREDTQAMIEDAEVSLGLSRYMLHLLVMYPSLLPAGIGRVKFKDMYSMMTTFFEQHQSTGQEEEAMPENPTYANACTLLLNQVNTQLNLTVSSRDKSKLIMFYGCQLASQLQKIKQDRFRFWLLRETWIGMLVLAASKCKASYHVQQLRRGGELLTHVWLLLVHYGLTDHFQIPKTVEIAELNIK